MSLICQKCKKPNRHKAKYCRYCGNNLDSHVYPGLGDLVGLKEVKMELICLAKVIETMQKKRTRENKGLRLNLHTIIIGKAGTGKTTIAQVLQRIFYNYKIISQVNLITVDAVDFEKFMSNFEENYESAKGGILFIDNVQKLLPSGFASTLNPLDKLFAEMDKSANGPIIILAGLPDGFAEFLENNSSIRNRFDYLFELKEYTSGELFEICVLKMKLYGFILEQNAEKKLLSLMDYAISIRTKSFGNAHYSSQIAGSIIKSYYQRIADGEADDNLILESDIIGYIPKEKSLEEILHELDDFVGMREIKLAIKDIATQILISQERNKRELSNLEKMGMHIILTGNPGTGKTSIARKLGEIFRAIKFLEKGHVVETDREKLVGQYMGETPKLVAEACEKAKGGILFIDEAYTLAPDNLSSSVDLYGKEAVETLMKKMEDNRDDFVVIAAGYEDKMQNFLNINSGVRSRFDKYLHIEDYSPDELYEIFMTFVKKKSFVLEENAQKKTKEVIKTLYEKRDKSFANGRDMRKLFQNIISKFSERISKLPIEDKTDQALTTISLEDVVFESEDNFSIEQIINELNSLIGLDNIKSEIRDLIDYLKVEKKRQEFGFKTTSLNLHFVFAGNPGTGKTTVARLLAKILNAIGILSSGQIIECDRSKLVGAYLGQTALKTNEVVDRAMGGVLFIDEAYSLSQEGSLDSYGREAIDTLLKRMEDDRGKFSVIVAGYTDQMNVFLKSNPGLASRFTKFLIFEDYSAFELHKIFVGMLNLKNMVLTDEANLKAINIFNNAKSEKSNNFSNGRFVRNYFEGVLQKQSRRIAKIMKNEEINSTQINQIILEDL